MKCIRRTSSTPRPLNNHKYGFGPMYCFGDWTGEPLAARLRWGNAAPNQVSDLTEVLDAAIRALPKRMRVGHSPCDDPERVAYRIRVRADSAAGPAFATECHKRNIGFSFVARRSDGIAEALSHIPPDDPRWQPALPQPRPAQNNNPNSTGAGNPDTAQAEDPEPQRVRAHVIELTDHVKAYRWPKGLRLVIRREPRHPGAKRSLFDSERLPLLGTLDRPTPTRPRNRPRHARPRPSRNPHRPRQRPRRQPLPIHQIRSQPALAPHSRPRRHPAPLVPKTLPTQTPPPHPSQTQNTAPEPMAHTRHHHPPQPTNHPPNTNSPGPPPPSSQPPTNKPKPSNPPPHPHTPEHQPHPLRTHPNILRTGQPANA